MGTKTLEELKAENEAAEKKAAEEAALAASDRDDVVDPDIDPDGGLDVDPDPEADPDVDPDAEPELDPWQTAADDQASGTQTMPVSAHVKAKHKFRGQIAERDTEIERLQAELEQARSGTRPAAQTGQRPPKPTLASCDHDEDKYEEALLHWMDAVVDTKLQGNQVNASQVAAQKAHEQAVTDHYVRAEKLAEESGIKPEAYKATDTLVRESFEAINPGLGDMIVDQLISRVGEGSEKVIYYLGRNPAELVKVQNALASDPSGLTAAVMMGQLNARIGSPTKRKQTTKAPATQIKGDEGSKGNADGRAFKRRYDEAVKKNDPQARFNARREASKAGVDVSTW